MKRPLCGRPMTMTEGTFTFGAPGKDREIVSAPEWTRADQVGAAVSRIRGPET
jgi:hypothetical protein